MHNDDTEAVLSDTVCFFITRMQPKVYIENYFVWDGLELRVDMELPSRCGQCGLQLQRCSNCMRYSN